MVPDATPVLRLYAKVRQARLAREDPVEAQAGQLLRLVHRAAATRFGRDHGFASIRSVADYQSRVPLRRYEDFFGQYWKMAGPALTDATWPGRIPYLAFTSGTSSGSGKLLPVSRAMLAANRRAALEVLVHHLANRPDSRVLGGKSFILGGSTDLVRLDGGVLKGDLSGIAANEVPTWARLWSFPPRAAALEVDWERKIDRLSRLSLGEDIRSLSGTPSWVLLFLECAEAAAGRGPGLAALYPRLELYVHGGVSFRPYRERFRRLLAGSRAETREVYPASEGFVAIADRGDGEGMRVLADNGLFFEFVPAGEVEAPRPVRHWAATAEPGIDYAIVLSSCAGLWSYLLGDTVRIIDRCPLRLLITGRLSYQLNVFGEHLSGEQIEDAVLAGAARAGLAVTDYASGALFPDRSPRGRHIFVVEFSLRPGPEATAEFAVGLDAALQAGSLDYRERRAGAFGLLPPDVLAVPPGFFSGWMRRRGRQGGQNKVPRVVTDEAVLADLMATAQACPPEQP